LSTSFLLFSQIHTVLGQYETRSLKSIKFSFEIPFREFRLSFLKIWLLTTHSITDSTIDVRQGSCEGPVLFLFIIQAAMETLQCPGGVARPEFKTRKSDVAMGENSNRKRDATLFELWASLFADDCALLFNSRDEFITVFQPHLCSPSQVWSANAHWSRRHGIQNRGDVLSTSTSSVRGCGHVALSRRRYGIYRAQ
jgi:hypothetical protein